MSSALSVRLAAPPKRRRLLAALLPAQVCGSTRHSISLPVAVAALGAALASLPLARLMGRFGRRPGLVLGYGLAVLGSGLGMAGVLAGSFMFLLLGMALFGIGNTSNLLSRYAAADVSPGVERGRAIGLVVWGATAGSIIGPILLGLAAELGGRLGLTTVGSAFLIGVSGFGLAALLIEALLRPDPLAVARLREPAPTDHPTER